MTGTVVDVPIAPLQIAQPLGPRSAGTGMAAKWQAAKTVLVTRVVGPRQLMTVPRLVVPVGDTQLAFRVSSHSPEADQLDRDGRVLVQAGDWRGNPALGSHQHQGQAQLVTGGTLLPYVQAEIDAKYRWRIPMARLAHRLARGAAPYGDVIILVTVQEPSPIPLPPA
ncbi:hypothetical protein [Nocardia terpenica]|uniref:PPOX class F420-dependent enzyme n=1 Tax=Nocardia terpenica TaxID=455432 RepID=A0A291RK14_9NOCA|nr:hypothetical protein [Nocardia terpenica]ATL67926.1 hypothetical protein CRH09_18730 [Nocardia terpenica]